MKWFGSKAAGASPRPVLTRGWLGGGGVGGEWPATYEAQLRDGVMANPVAQRALRLVSESVGGLALRAFGGTDAHRSAMLALVAERSAGQALMETLAAHLLLHGNGYAQLARGADGMVVALYALRPERVTVEPDAQGWPMAYQYRSGGSVARYASEDAAGRTAIIHIKALHPLDDHYGLGCAGAAAGAVAIHNGATVWNKALLDNAARPSGALVYEPGDGTTLSPEQFDRLKAEMLSAFQGSGNAGRPMLLEGGLRWQAMSMTPADMDFVGLKAAAAREIALAFGVPPMLMGLPGDTAYANYREANKALWRQTVLPLADKILGALAQGLGAWFPGVGLGVDMNALPALADERAMMWEQVAGADFLSADEKRMMLGLSGEGAGDQASISHSS